MITSDGRTPVEVEIESLSLDGFDPADRYRITAAFQSELARLIETEGLPPAQDGRLDLPRLDGGSLKLARGAAPASIGAQIARSLFHSIVKALRGNQHD